MAKILIIDDSEETLLLISSYLEKDSHHAVTATSVFSGIEKARLEQPDLILLDIHMPDFNGLSAISVFKGDEVIKSIPIIMLTANDNDDAIVSAFDLGAHDYVSKKTKYPVLSARIRAALNVTTFQQELAEANKKLELMAATDFLTSLYNRRYFYELSNREMLKAKRYKNPISLIMIDADRFKQINDEHGHGTGDKALKTLARVCKMNTRETDIIGRLGGEEFAICCPYTAVQDAVNLAERIREDMKAEIFDSEHQDLHVTVSMGVAELDLESAYKVDAECGKTYTLLDDLLKQADKYLYQAKNNGRDLVVSHLSQ